MEDSDGTISSVAQCIEQLRRSSSNAEEKEVLLKQLLDLIDTRENAFSAVGSHSQAVPVLVSLLRSGSSEIKILSASVLGTLCMEDELRIKVLLGGCIPPLLALLKSSSAKSQIAAAKTIFSVSQGGVKDHVGSKIFSTERVVPALWEQLQRGLINDNMVDNLLTGALRNLSNNTDGFCSATLESGGVDILLKLLATGQSNDMANVCFLLGFLMMEDASVCYTVLAASATKHFLKLLGASNEAPIRAGAAGALKSLSAQCKEARREIASLNGIPALINATIAPSKEFMQGEAAQSLQENAMCALANISGGLSYVISSLGESLDACSTATQIADTLGALASALMIYDNKAESTRASDPVFIEQNLVKQLKSKLPFLAQERTIEALASLYGNTILSRPLSNSSAKRLLVGLITMATNEVHDDLIRSLLILCNSGSTLWHALQGREGVQLLISLLGLSSEQQQEYAVALLSLLSNENDECKWSITAAGGIPPLVQILEAGSVKAKEDSATILGNLCNHSEDIRACVESADAVPALLWLLKNGSEDGKGIAARTLNHLIHKSDTGTISQLSSLLISEQPESKVYVLDALRSLLCVAPLSDLLRKGSAANDAIETMIRALSSPKEDIQATSASALAGLFNSRKDLRESYFAVKTLWSVLKLLMVESDRILIEAASCLAAIFLSIKQNKEVAVAARDALPPLVSLVNYWDLRVAERATWALSNILLDREISLRAIPEELIMPVTRVLRDGTTDGKTHAAAAVARFLQYRSSEHVLTDGINRAGTIVALVTLLESSDIQTTATSEILDALAMLSRTKGTDGDTKPPWALLIDHPCCISPLVSCITEGTPPLQDKAIEVLSRFCESQPHSVGNAVATVGGCVASIASRVTVSSSMRIKVSGAALLVCSAKEHQNKTIGDLNDSSLGMHLIFSLVGILRSVKFSTDQRNKESFDDIIIYRCEQKQLRPGECNHTISVIAGATVATWLLAVLASYSDKNKITAMDAGAIDILINKISQHMASVPQV